jgi:uncharacterized protein YbjQ (UPF0145 family)
MNVRQSNAARSVLISALFAATAASASDAQVALVKDETAVAGCERLTEIKGSSAWGGMVQNMAYNRALSQLKARAEKLGATHVLLLDVSSGTMGSNMLGVAYKCTAPPPALPEK